MLCGQGLDVDRIGLVPPPAGVGVRLVDLTDLDSLGVQVASQASAVGAGGLHPNPIDRAEAAQPTGELPITSCGRGEGGLAEATTNAVQRNRVVVSAWQSTPPITMLVGTGIPIVPLPSWTGGGPAGTGGHNSDGAFVAQVPMRSHRPDWPPDGRAGQAPGRVDESRE